LMHGMIALQVAFCFFVLLIAGLFVTTFKRLSNKPTGFSAERILLLETTSRPAQSPIYWDQAADHLRSIPGVERVSQASWPLLKGVGWNDSISVNGGPPSVDLAYFLNVSPGFLETMRIALIGGRDFRDGDLYNNTAIVNETFARRFLNDDNPVGKAFEIASDDGKRQPMQVVGVMRDAYYRDIREPMLPVVFVPFLHKDEKDQMLPEKEETFVVLTAAANPMAMASTLRQEVSRVRPEFHVSNARTQVELDQAQMIRERLLATLAFFFGAVALLLAGVGLYGVLNYSVLQQQREIGIRMALGAQVGDVARRVMTGISVAVGIGAVAGLALGLASVRYIESLLYEVKATDAGVLAIPCLTILLAVVVAAVPPVLRALRIDPVAMLRVE
jgi:predicted permease